MRAALLALVCCVALRAQPKTDLTKPPETPPLASIKLPPVTRMELANGLRVVVIDDRRLPLVTVRLGFLAGGKYEPMELPYVSEFVAALLTEGTKSRSSKQFAEDLAGIGATLKARAGADGFSLAGDAPSEYAGTLLDLLADAARNANFPDSEIALRKQNRKQELLAERSQSAALVQERVSQAVYGAHPYSRTLPRAGDVDRITRQALLAYRDARLIPNQAVLVLIGPLPERATTAAWIEQRFGAWEKKPVPPAPPAAEIPEPKRTLVLVDRPGSVQADIMTGRRAPTRKDPDWLPLEVANSVLGGMGDSRLFVNVREKQGFAYDAHSELDTHYDAALVGAVTQVRNEVAAAALESVFKEMKLVATEPLSPAELESVKNYLNGMFVMRLEAQSGLADQVARLELEGLPRDLLETYVAKVRAVTAGQALEAARKYLDPAQAAVVVVGDAAKIRSQVEKFGKVTVEKAKE